MEEKELIKWNDKLLTNITIIDQQHMHFVSLLNLLFNKFENLAPKEDIDLLLSELINYAATHFATEEGYMEKYHYPALQEHKLVHKQLTEELSKLVNEYKVKGKVVLPDIFDFLENWLVKHLDIYDGKYAKYFAEIGVRE